MLCPPENNSPCPDCEKAGRKGKLRVQHTSWGWEVRCSNKECDFYDAYHSPNAGREPWQPIVYGASLE